MARASDRSTVRNQAINPDLRRHVFIDVFAGCGGLSLGLKRAGWQGLFAIEKDAFAFETLDSNFSHGSRHEYDWPSSIERQAWDIHDLLRTREGELAALAGKVDLLAGGPPCQGFSQAGRRRIDDPRNLLFEAYLELVRLLKPKLVLIENVQGFTKDFASLQSSGIENFAESLRERLSLDYQTISAVIRSSDFGVPQTRPRFFLAGARKGIREASVIPRFFSMLDAQRAGFLARRNLSRFPTARDAISDLELRLNGAMPCADSAGFEAISYLKPRTPFQLAMRDGFEGCPPDTRLARHRPEVRERFASIMTSCHEDGRLNISISSDLRKAHGLKKMALRVLDPLSPAPTITSLPDDLLHYSEPRTLTVRENARLQTFPDWFSFKGKYTTGGHLRRREVPRFTQVANAVPPLLAEQIGLVLLAIAGANDGQVFIKGGTD
jgi:DNA (cytosine-5)-methyltransferase 1